MMDLTHLNEDNMVIRYNNQRQNLLLLKHGLLILILIFFSEARNLLYTVSNRWDNTYHRKINQWWSTGLNEKYKKKPNNKKAPT